MNIYLDVNTVGITIKLHIPLLWYSLLLVIFRCLEEKLEEIGQNMVRIQEEHRQELGT